MKKVHKIDVGKDICDIISSRSLASKHTSSTLLESVPETTVHSTKVHQNLDPLMTVTSSKDQIRRYQLIQELISVGWTTEVVKQLLALSEDDVCHYFHLRGVSRAPYPVTSGGDGYSGVQLLQELYTLVNQKFIAENRPELIAMAIQGPYEAARNKSGVAQETVQTVHTDCPSKNNKPYTGKTKLMIMIKSGGSTT